MLIDNQDWKIEDTLDDDCHKGGTEVMCMQEMLWCLGE